MVYNPDEVEKEFSEEENKREFLQIKKITLENGDYGHPFACRVYFSNNTIWTCEFKDLYNIMEFLGKSEEKKYKNYNGESIPEKEIKEFKNG